MSSGRIAANAQPAAMTETISVSEVKRAQEAWCDALVSIRKLTTKAAYPNPNPWLVL